MASSRMEHDRPAPPPSAAAPTGAPRRTFPPPQPEDRTQLDSRRVIARADRRHVRRRAAPHPRARPRRAALDRPRRDLTLTYFFVCEAVWGQTIGKRIIGLRVLMADGAPGHRERRRGAHGAAARSTTARSAWSRILGSGKRRQRLGDLARRHDRRPPDAGRSRAPRFSPLAARLSGRAGLRTVALVLALADPQARTTTTSGAVDKACASSARELNAATPPGPSTIDAIVARKRADHRALARASRAPDAASQDCSAEILTLDERGRQRARPGRGGDAKGQPQSAAALRAGRSAGSPPREHQVAASATPSSACATAPAETPSRSRRAGPAAAAWR